MSGYLDIILLVVLVVVIFSKLKSILGTGAEDTKIIMISKEQFEKAYQELKKNNAFNESNVTQNAENMSPLDKELMKIPNFDKNTFLKGAQKAFEMILSSFSKGDAVTLSKLVNKDLLKKFEEVIEERKAEGLGTVRRNTEHRQGL